MAHTGPQGPLAAGAGVAAVADAVTQLELAVALVDLSDQTVRAVSRAGLERLGLPSSAVLNRPLADLAVGAERLHATEALTALSHGVIDSYVAHHVMHAPADGPPLASQWVQAFDVDGRRVALASSAVAGSGDYSPLGELLGREPPRMAVGALSEDLVIAAMSCDVDKMLGIQSTELIGSKLTSVVARGDVKRVLAARELIGQHSVALPVHMRAAGGKWRSMCLVLASLLGEPALAFILMPEPEEPPARTAELEQHLWRIAAIIDASGVLQRTGPMRDITKVPQANALTARQWEVLARIARGDRAPTIAREMHVSPSTVRNHLSAIFKQFGVHSQPELLRALDEFAMT